MEKVSYKRTHLRSHWTLFNVLGIWGGIAGRWSKRKVDFDDIEVMVIAEKPFVKNKVYWICMLIIRFIVLNKVK